MKERSRSFDALTPMMSYAQQAEDVVLRRALYDVKSGFYVDLGAGSPDSDSVTRYFYEEGWHGINIEPQPNLYHLLCEKRPRDINLQIAIGATVSRQILTTYPDKWGWASISDDVRAMHEANGVASEEITVNVRPLNDVLDEYAILPIDFLKIDIEGGEKEALQTLDYDKWSPTIIVIEATKPGSSTSIHDEWEQILLAHGYKCALFDGLNRFYAKSDAIIDRLGVPANTFDKYTPYRWWRLLLADVRQELKEKRGLGEAFSIEDDLRNGQDSIDWV